jgi:hypothetical protein
MAYRIERSVTVQAPPEAVWNVVQDVSRRLEWDVRIKSAELLTPLPMGKGSRTRIAYNLWGYVMDIEIDMISWKPYDRSGVKGKVLGTGDTFGASWNFVHNPDGSTTWTTRIAMTSQGPFARLRELFSGVSTDLMTVVSQRNLKRLVEAEQRAARPA